MIERSFSRKSSLCLFPVALSSCDSCLFACFQERCYSDHESLIDATLVASCLYLLHGFISPNYQDLAQVLLVHPRVGPYNDVLYMPICGKDIS